MANVAPRMLIIGLDGASPQLMFDRMRPMLPVWSQLLDTSIWGELESVIPVTSLPAWPALFSGRDPGELGMYGARQRTDHTYDPGHPVSSRSIQVPLLWDVLTHNHMTSVIIGPPPNFPPRRVRGISVSCLLTPPHIQRFTWPVEYSERIIAHFPHFAFDLYEDPHRDAKDTLEAAAVFTTQHFELLRMLLEEQHPDCAVLVDPTLDRLQHAYWDRPEVLHQHLTVLDQELAKTLELLSSETVILLISDHGLRTSNGAFAINDWLISQGLLCLATKPTTPTPLHQLPVDWHHTIAWAEGGQTTRLTLNVTNREPHGIVEPRVYEQVRNDLKRRIESIVGPNGRTMGNRCHKPEEIFTTTTGIPPDLLCLFNNLGFRSVSSVGHSELFLPPTPGHSTGNHAENGIIVLHWPHHGPNGRRQGVRLLDIFPTLLSIFDLDIPPDLIGRPVIA